jgi:hypothetical protein
MIVRLRAEQGGKPAADQQHAAKGERVGGGDPLPRVVEEPSVCWAEGSAVFTIDPKTIWNLTRGTHAPGARLSFACRVVAAIPSAKRSKPSGYVVRVG